MDEETPARKALAAVGETAQSVTGLPEEFGPFSSIEVTLGRGHPPTIFMEYEDSAGAYHHREFEIDLKTMREEDADDLILRPSRRVGEPFVDFFEDHGPFEVRK